MGKMFSQKFLPAILIAIVAMLSSSCSYMVNFAVVNNSDSDLEVEYTFKNYIWAPTKMNQAEWEKWFGESEWRDVPQTEYKFEAETRKFALKISPKEVVKILSAHDGIYFVEDANFELAKIKLSGKNGTIIYEGDRLYKQFEEKNYTNRFITYK